MVNLKFIKGDREWNVDVDPEKCPTILDVAHSYDIDLECACAGSLACSTCHIIFEDQSAFNNCCQMIPISDAENDMLDLAYGLEKCSRLGCQIKITEELEGSVLKIPHENRNSSPVSSS